MLLACLGSVRIGKNCDLRLENAALGLQPRSQFFPIRTSQPANNIYTAISINVVGSKHKARRQDRKVRWDFFLNKFMKTSYASPVQ